MGSKSLCVAQWHPSYHHTTLTIIIFRTPTSLFFKRKKCSCHQENNISSIYCTYRHTYYTVLAYYRKKFFFVQEISVFTPDWPAGPGPGTTGFSPFKHYILHLYNFVVDLYLYADERWPNKQHFVSHFISTSFPSSMEEKYQLVNTAEK